MEVLAQKDLCRAWERKWCDTLGESELSLMIQIRGFDNTQTISILSLLLSTQHCEFIVLTAKPELLLSSGEGSLTLL